MGTSAIPNYGLKDENGNPILSRNKRFNHPWYCSKILRIEDNISFDDMKRGCGIQGQGGTQLTIAQIEKLYSRPS